MEQESWWTNKLRCNLNSSLRNRASGAHHWNTHKNNPNKHVKQDWCQTSGKFLRKWPKTRIFTYLGAQSGPKIGPLGRLYSPLIYKYLHRACDRCESRGNLLTKYSKTWILTHWEAKKRPKNSGLSCPSFTRLQIYLQWACKSSFKWIQQNLFKIMDEKLYIDLFCHYLGPKRVQKFSPQSHFSHTPESIHNIPANRIPLSRIRNFLKKWQKNF